MAVGCGEAASPGSWRPSEWAGLRALWPPREPRTGRAGPSRGVAGEAPGAAARPVSTWRRSDGRVSCPVAGLRERGRGFILSRRSDLSGASPSRLAGSGDSGRSGAVAQVEENGPSAPSCPDESA